MRRRRGPLVAVAVAGALVVVAAVAGYPSWRIGIKLEPGDVPAFAGLTREIAAEPATTPQRLLAIVVDGEILSAPEVQEALAGGDIEITGTFTRQEAETLVRQILGSR